MGSASDMFIFFIFTKAYAILLIMMLAKCFCIKFSFDVASESDITLCTKMINH